MNKINTYYVMLELKIYTATIYFLFDQQLYVFNIYQKKHGIVINLYINI